MQKPRNLLPRIIGELGNLHDEVRVVFFAGIHGNEPAGVEAVQRVLAKVRQTNLPVSSRVLFLSGNRSALEKKQRYLQRDLNRGWTRSELEALKKQDLESLRDEDREQRELIDLLDPLMEQASQPIVFIDLHTMSGDGPPFVAAADVLRNRKPAFALPIPLVLGLEEVIDASMLGYLCDLGHTGIAVEGGQHGDPKTIDRHEAVVWCSLVAQSCLQASDIDFLEEMQDRLHNSSTAFPQVVEICHRHVVEEDDTFVMRAGYRNLLPVQKGEALAQDQNGEIRSPCDGLVMLPRYQPTGEDGFFIARPVAKFWLRLSAFLRGVGLDRVLPLFPGIQTHPFLEDHFVLNRRRARFFADELLHLFGFRRRVIEQEFIVFSRRRPGHHKPS